MILSRIINNKAELLSHIDPERIYVENVRSFFNIQHQVARFFCEMAVKQKFFEKKYGIVCPNDDCHRIITSINKISELPTEIKCEHCELMERDNYIFKPLEADLILYYKLSKKK
jgi:hypothetical protein